MKRFGQLIGVKPDTFEVYKAYHARVWPEVLETIRQCHIHNYSIFHWQGQLFAYFEYQASITRPTWPKWPPTPRPKSGGRS